MINQLPIYAIIVVALISGCSQARTVPPGTAPPLAPQPATKAASSPFEPAGRTTVSTPAPTNKAIEAPTFEADPAVVYQAALRACHAYFNRVDIQDDAKHHIEINNRAFWAGDTYVTIDVVKTPEGKASVAIYSKGRGINQPLWNRSSNDINGFLKHLRLEMAKAPAAPATVEERLRALEDLRVKQLVSEEEYQAKRKAILAEL